MEKNGRFAQDMAGLYEFRQTCTEHLIGVIHLEQARLVLAEGDIEVVYGLSRAGADGDEWSGIIEWADVNGIAFAVDLRGKKADATGHLLDAADLADE